MKVCRICNAEKPLADFPARKPEGKGKRRPKGDGYRGECRKCFNAQKKAWLDRHPGYHAAANKKWHAKNPDYNQRYVAENADAVRERRREYVKNNPDIPREISRRYARCRRRAAPRWLTPEQHQKMDDMRILSQLVTEETGIIHQVDHIVPLQGKTVCGLHVPWNLQVIPASENKKKYNKLSADASRLGAL